MNEKPTEEQASTQAREKVIAVLKDYKSEEPTKREMKPKEPSDVED